MPGGVELHAEVDQQPRMAGKEFERTLEGGDRAGADAALGEGVTRIEQRFGVARVGCVSKRSFEQGVGVADPPFDKRASRVVQQRLRVARDSCRAGEKRCVKPYANRYFRCASQPSCGERLKPLLANSIQRPTTKASSALASVTGSPGQEPPAWAILSD